jgi:hypothetical protein
MKRRMLPLSIAAGAGLLCAGILFGMTLNRAEAQFGGTPQLPALPPALLQGNGTQTSFPQPIEIQTLDSTHFVVVTREPRIMVPVGGDGKAMQVLATVVTYYAVQGTRLVPVEHVRVPPGFRLVQLEQ